MKKNFKHKFFLNFILLVFFGFGFSIQEKYNNQNKLQYLNGQIKLTNNDFVSSAWGVLDEYSEKIGIDSNTSFIIDRNKAGFNQTHHISLQQAYKGTPVFGKYIKIHANKHDFISSVSSNIIQIDLDNNPKYNDYEIVKIIQEEVVKNNGYIKNHGLMIYQKNKIHLVYAMDYIDFEFAWKYMIDAHSGKIVDQIPLIYDAGPTIGSGTNLLNESIADLNIYEGSSFESMGGDLITPNLICQEFCWDYGDCDNQNYSDCIVFTEQGNCEDGYILDCDGTCFNEWYMQFPGVGNGFCNDPWIEYEEANIDTGDYNMVDINSETGNIYTINSYGGFYSNMSYVQSTTNEFNSTVSSESHKAGVSAHDYQRKTLDYFYDKHGYAGLDGLTKRTVSVINYFSTPGGLDQRNAFYNAALGVLSYGKGGNGYRPFCAALDIVAHEFSHGFTAYTSGLIYRNQAGALNESMSDVFGYLIEAEFQDGGDWVQGEDVHYVGASRSFINPPDYNQPDNINHPYFVEYSETPLWSNDFGGVHVNSGIPNKVLYLVINGDVHYGISVSPFSDTIEESRDIASNIWFAWNSYYLDPEDDFVIGYEKMIQACSDLYPNNPSYLQTLNDAWKSVGIEGNLIALGDLNEDTIINIQDIILMVNIIMDTLLPSANQSISGDLNQDGLIDILDIVSIVNVILD